MLKVAIIGRPNVGKSTLFNRLARKKLAIVHDLPGVTRDRKETEIEVSGKQVLLIDTAGLSAFKPGDLEERMVAQTNQAVDEADLVLFVIDGAAGVTPDDKHYAKWVRAKGKPVVLAANKCEKRDSEAMAHEAYKLGFGEPIAISAAHGMGIPDLLEAVASYELRVTSDDEIEESPEERSDDLASRGGRGGGSPAIKENTTRNSELVTRNSISIAIIGRPNAGKSTLMNRLLGEERMMTGPEAGITRDAIMVDWKFEGQDIKLVDTAGLRRKSRVTQSLEKLMTGDSINAIRYAHVVVLLVDAGDLLHKQDLTLADYVLQEGRALVIGVNKIDEQKKPDEFMKLAKAHIESSLAQARGLEVVGISAIKGDGVKKLMRAAIKAYERWNSKVPTGELNRWLEYTLERQQPPVSGKSRIKIKYITQAKSRPPTFVLFGSQTDKLPDSYTRYLTNSLRERFDLPGVPIRLHLRKPKNPYL